MTARADPVHAAIRLEPGRRSIRVRERLLQIGDGLIRRDAADEECPRRLALIGDAEGVRPAATVSGSPIAPLPSATAPLPAGIAVVAPLAAVTLIGRYIPFATWG